MRAALILTAALMAAPLHAQTREQVDAIVSQCIFDHTDATFISFTTDKRDGAIVLKFSRKMNLSKAEKTTVTDCVVGRMN